MVPGSSGALDGMSILPEIRCYHCNIAGTLSTVLNLQDGGLGKLPPGGSERNHRRLQALKRLPEAKETTERMR